MSKHNRVRRMRRLVTGVFGLQLETAPEYSEKTLGKLKALAEQFRGTTGVHHVAILHEQFCVEALKRGAKKCVCDPDVRIVTPDSKDPVDQNAYKNHWFTQEGH